MVFDVADCAKAVGIAWIRVASVFCMSLSVIFVTISFFSIVRACDQGLGFVRGYRR